MDVIAIDGAAATGKTTTAAGVARELGFVYVDSGAIYRTAALAVVRAPGNRDLRSVLQSAGISAAVGPHGFQALLDGKPVSDEIRTPEITKMSSVLATREEVRERVVEILRELAETSGSPLVVEGRDIGTVVFPDALLKVFMVANLVERARRRLKDLEAKGVESSVQDVETELAERDGRDSGREVAPLARHPEAILVDTTQLTIPEQIQIIVRAYREKKATLR
jgi:cytidylate kinase